MQYVDVMVPSQRGEQGILARLKAGVAGCRGPGCRVIGLVPRRCRSGASFRVYFERNEKKDG